MPKLRTRRSAKVRGPVTVLDVARDAEVAVGTVSRVINGHPSVAEPVRRRVLGAVERLGYVRIRARKPPRARQSSAGQVAVVCFGMEDTLVHIPVVSAALQGIERALSDRGRSLLLANIPRGDRIPAFLEDPAVAGVILKGPNQGLLPPPEASPLVRRLYSLPLVWLMGQLPNARGDHCNFDPEKAGALAAAHLAELGHQRIGFLDPKPGQVQFERIKRGFLHALAERGLACRLFESEPGRSLAWPLPAITDQNKVAVLLARWRALPPAARPTALFAPSDRTAVQVYTELERGGLKVGRDVSLISCNNETSLVMGLTPALTTIDIHPALVGRCAVEQLLSRAAAGPSGPSVQVQVEPSLVVRGSVARLA